MVDDVTREQLRLITDTSISGQRVAGAQDAAINPRAKPAMHVSANGTG